MKGCPALASVILRGVEVVKLMGASTAVTIEDPGDAILQAASQFQPANQQAALSSFKALSTGNGRLDALLGGGYPGGQATLMYGPPFCGKQILQQLSFVAAACRGVPSTYILHGVSAESMSARLGSLDARFEAAERAGLVTYVDVHSHFLGESVTHPNALVVADPHDPAQLIKALELRAEFPRSPGLLAIQSASTILMDLGPVRAFQFLRTIVGRVVKTGGVGLVCLQAGMHSEPEVQMAKHVCAGMLELRKKGEIQALHIEGLETTVARPGWIEYEFTPRLFKVTGGFATRYIR